jgi:hypothetical protein
LFSAQAEFTEAPHVATKPAPTKGLCHCGEIEVTECRCWG